MFNRAKKDLFRRHYKSYKDLIENLICYEVDKLYKKTNLIKICNII